jgi:DNA primase catalytic subunit
MIDLRHGWNHIPLRLSGTRRYHAEEVFTLIHRHRRPIWLYVDGHRIALPTRDAEWVACQAAAAYHNYLAHSAPEPDGFAEEIAESEARVRAHMEASSSEDDANYVTSDEDMDYPTEFYI